ncbi:MAG TPA: SPOR domain-containing protein [Verrucomicrobiae bacterium]|nr:SPOR domain-containing protein [Verrucomicrobiae bacterium]
MESRHLIGLFLGVVLLCCVFFTLGYVMGKTQYGNTPVEAASLDSVKSLPPTAKPAPAQTPASTEWDFYTEKKTTDVPLKPQSAKSGVSDPSAPSVVTAPRISPNVPASRNIAPAASRPSRNSAALPPSRYRAPRMSRNAIVLQVGALRSQSDALAMTDALQRKGFPAFVVVPASDSFYRVQVGPFPTQAVGEKAKQSLEREGFKAIYRR